VRRRLAPWLLVLVAALAYPLAVLAGGAPRFPTRAECVHPVVEGQEIEAVFGRFERADDAEAEYRRVVGAGFSGTELKPDGCGFLKVAVHGIPSVDVGHELAAEAEKAGFHVTLERYVP
jgi:hypothetical protein